MTLSLPEVGEELRETPSTAARRERAWVGAYLCALGFLGVHLVACAENSNDVTVPIATHPVWEALTAQSILEDSPRQTIVYPHLSTLAHYNGPITFSALPNSDFMTGFLEDNLVLLRISPDWNGTDTVEVHANQSVARFALTVAAVNDTTRWLRPLPSINIPNETPNDTAIIDDLPGFVRDPDDPVMLAVSQPGPYLLSMQEGDLVIRDIPGTYWGEATVTVIANGVPATFTLTVRRPFLEEIYHEPITEYHAIQIFANEHVFVIRGGGLEEIRDTSSFQIREVNPVTYALEDYVDTGRFIYSYSGGTLKKRDRATLGVLTSVSYAEVVCLAANSCYVYALQSTVDGGGRHHFMDILDANDLSYLNRFRFADGINMWRIAANDQEVIMAYANTPGDVLSFEVRTVPGMNLVATDTLNCERYDFYYLMRASRGYFFLASHERVKLYDRYSKVNILTLGGGWGGLTARSLGEKYFLIGLQGHIPGVFDLSVARLRAQLQYDIPAGGAEFYGDKLYVASPSGLFVYRIND